MLKSLHRVDHVDGLVLMMIEIVFESKYSYSTALDVMIMVRRRELLYHVVHDEGENGFWMWQ